MSNRSHLIAVPCHEHAGGEGTGALGGRLCSHLNVRRRTSGHLWHPLPLVPIDSNYCWRALAHVERNPVRYGITSAIVALGVFRLSPAPKD